MKQKGFGTTDLIAFLFVVLLSLIIVTILYSQMADSLQTENDKMEMFDGKNVHNEQPTPELNTQNYVTLEESIAEKSKNYFSNNTTDSKIDYVTLLTLKQNNYIGNIHAIDDDTQECTGYVEFLKVSGIYKTYLKCGEIYQTSGYDVLKEVE